MGSNVKALAVSEVNALARKTLEREFGNLLVEGEISNLSAATSGHLYFTLKDEKAQISCAMWRNAARRLRFSPESGLQVQVRGRLTVYESGGRYQLIVESMEPAGLGDLERKFRELKADYEAKGWFAESLKKPLPYLPARIGIVTSLRGAAVRDLISTITARFARPSLLIADVIVQGPGAAAEIAAAIQRFNREQLVDVMIVGRGGGSLEDLWAFNEPLVVEAIHDSHIPVISAVGHEVDFSLADFVADYRAATPTAAGEMVLPKLSDLELHLGELRIRLTRTVTARLASARQQLQGHSKSWALREPRRLVESKVQRLDEIRLTLPKALRRRVALEQARLEALRRGVGLRLPQQRIALARERLSDWEQAMPTALQRRVESLRVALVERERLLAGLSPLRVLERGYSLTRDEETGEIIRSADTLQPHQRLRTRFAKGEIRSRVEGTSSEPEPDPLESDPQVGG
ncbi:MAG: exodeoxyribonuclease VII large subunit [Planctomycetota bacterium]